MPKPTILIVDDDRDIVDAIEAILSMESYEVTHAYEGRTGLQIVRDRMPDLILLDYMLPDMNGKEITLEIKENAQTQHIPVILVSAAREAHEIASQIPVNGFIEKPFEMELLLKTVRSHLS